MANLRKLRAFVVFGIGLKAGNNMKKQNRKWLWLAPFGVAGMAAGVLAVLHPGLHAETSPDNPDPQMRTRVYNADIELVRKNVLEIIPQLKCYGAQWRLAVGNAENKVSAEVPVLMFTDDLTVTLIDLENGTRVDVYSQTQFQGKSDLGENRRHILQLLAALDEKLSE